MSITTFSSREFNQDTSGAKKATAHGPVFITDRGRPSHVLLTIDDYRRLTGEAGNLAESLSMPADDHTDFTPPTLGSLTRPADLS